MVGPAARDELPTGISSPVWGLPMLGTIKRLLPSPETLTVTTRWTWWNIMQVPSRWRSSAGEPNYDRPYDRE